MPQVELLSTGAADDEDLMGELARVINHAYALGEDGLWVEGTTRTSPAQVAELVRSGGMLVATLDGQVVGCGFVRPLDATTLDLGLISASPEHRGIGVGREIVRSAEALARARGVTTMQLELLVPQGWVHPQKDRLRAWYTRLGYETVRSAPFEEIATHSASQLATPCEFLVFRKALTDGPNRRRRSRSGQLRDALIWGMVLGAGAGAVLGHAIDGVGAGLGALIGAVVNAPTEALAVITRGPAAPSPLWRRILSSALLMALFGALLGLVYDAPLFVAVISGGLLGALGLRPLKVAIGLAVGAVVGALLQVLDESLAPALVAAAVTIAYRAIAAFAYRNRPLVRIMAEEVPASELRYVVPFEARSKYVGADYVEQLAKVRGGTFRRNPPDVGIIGSLESLEGPTFDPARVHPLIREFYEHTSRFRLSIVPEWRQWMKPGYEVFKRLVAEPLGQAAIPSNIEEAQRGMVSTIDTIDFEGDEVIDIRGWIRTFADSGKPIYVGIYTSFRHEDRGYVSVGFPIPSANFTATLLPRNVGEHDLLLTSRTDLPFPGHYLSSVDSERDALTVLKLLAFQEEIHVYVVDGELRTDHSFFLARQRFLTLHYEIERLAPQPR
jgi:GNAT superfamily N-acetyltransferase